MGSGFFAQNQHAPSPSQDIQPTSDPQLKNGSLPDPFTIARDALNSRKEKFDVYRLKSP